VLHVLLIDKGGRAAKVWLRLPASGRARVQRLLAPSALSISGVTLAGQRLGRDGRWHGRPVVQTVRAGVHRYEVLVPGTSAALVTIRLGGSSGRQHRKARTRSA
jgi:hypothetical protein